MSEEDLHCLTFGSINEEIDCTCDQTSEVAAFIPTTTLQYLKKDYCVNLHEIDNCILYNNTTLFSTSTFQCSECKSGYYLTKNICEVRKIRTKNCKTYKITEDFCEECNSGYYLTNEKLCFSYPTGIVNCTHYINENECTECKENYYLKENKCHFVKLVDRIDHCKLYLD